MKLERRSRHSCTVVVTSVTYSGYDCQRARKRIRQREVGKGLQTASVRLTDREGEIWDKTEREKIRHKKKEMRRDSSREGASSRHWTAALQRSGTLSLWPKAQKQPWFSNSLLFLPETLFLFHSLFLMCALLFFPLSITGLTLPPSHSLSFILSSTAWG